MVSKIDSLKKHARRHKAVNGLGQVRQGDICFLSTNQYVKNEKVYFAEEGG
jgi:hypothetical protein